MLGDAEAGHCRVADNLAEIALEPPLHMDDGLPALAIAQPPGVAAPLAAGQQSAGTSMSTRSRGWMPPAPSCRPILITRTGTASSPSSILRPSPLHRTLERPREPRQRATPSRLFRYSHFGRSS